MKNIYLFSFAMALCCGAPQSLLAYQIPKLTFERLPDGFRISIPDDKGVERVAFNVNRNRPFRNFEQGDFSEQIRSPIDGKYIFEIKRPFDDDDVIYVWVSVQYEKYIYRKIAEPISIRDGGSSSSNNSENNNNNNQIDPDATRPTVPTPRPKKTTTTALPPNPSECELPITRVTNQHSKQKYIPRCAGDEIFSEEFDSENGLNTDIWTAEVRLPTDLCEDEFVLYNQSNIEVHDGELSIRASIWNDNQPGTDVRQGILDLGDKCTEISQEYCTRRPHGAIVLPPIVSGRINTKTSFSFQYGRVVARVKFPRGDWLYPLLLLEPVMVLINDPFPCLHARIAFTRGNEHLFNLPHTEDIGGHRLSGGVVLTASENTRNQFMVNRTSLNRFADEFHIYEMIWNEEFMIFKVDQLEYGRLRTADVMHTGDDNANHYVSRNLIDREFAITLGVAAGGHADFPDRGYRKPWTNTAPKAALEFWRKRESWLGSWISPAMQDEPGIQSVLYAVEINEQCPAQFDYIKIPEEQFWTMVSRERLKVGDRLEISMLVQNGDNLFNKNEILEIGEMNYAFAVSPDEVSSNTIKSFDQCDVKRYCPESDTTFNGDTACSGTVIFEDGFDDSPLLNSKYWNYDVSLRLNGDGDEEFVMFSKDTATIFINDGHLAIKPVVIESSIQRGSVDLTAFGCTSTGDECSIKSDGSKKFLPPVKSAQINTKDYFKFKYGRVEIRAKLPKGDWIFPRLTLRSVDDSEPRIIIASALGNSKLLNGQTPSEQIGGEVLSGGILIWRQTNNRNGRELKQPVLVTRTQKSTHHYGDDFHNYTILWNKNGLTFGVDGANYGTIEQRLYKEYYLEIGVSAGGYLFFPDGVTNFQHTIEKPWQNMHHKAALTFWRSRQKWMPTWEGHNAMEVDYVRVFAI